MTYEVHDETPTQLDVTVSTSDGPQRLIIGCHPDDHLRPQVATVERVARAAVALGWWHA
jgi:hypothetical protein